MKLGRSEPELMADFYCMLPEEMTESALESIPQMNRKWEREFGKKKKRTQKLAFALEYPAVLKYFIDMVYEEQKESIPFSLEETGFQEVVSAYNAENYLQNTIFLFKKAKDHAIECREDLLKFIKSAMFRDILRGKFTGIPEPPALQELSVVSLPENNVVNAPVETLEKLTTQSEERMMRLYGRIDYRSGFYNFAPQYEQKNGELVPINAKKLFPPHGAFNLKESHGVVSEFLKALHIYDANSEEQSFYIIDMKESDLIENSDVNYQTRVDLAMIRESGRLLRNVIRPIQDACFYRVVTPRNDIDNSNFLDYIEISERECPEKEQVVLLQDHKLYGPFEVSSRYSDEKCIHPEAGLKNYLLDYMDVNECQRLEFEIQPHEKNPIPVTFCKFIPNGRKQDVISNDVLLDKLKENIRPELAVENPEEFTRLCANSPFLGNIPQEIQRNRIDRVRELISRGVIHKKEIVELTEELLHQVGRELPKNLITDSEAYQALTEEYRSCSERLEELQADLKNAREELEKYKDSMQIASSISDKEVEELKEELEQLRGKNMLCKEIEALQAENTKLHVENELLRKTQYELRAESKSLKKEVQDAITYGFEHRAEKAFDPYISHAMLEAAAQWDRTEETDKLQQYVTRITDQSPAELSGETLISELISRVQAKRNYSPNMILNILISIVQNFMTVFSGEPGIGKTSICDILANALGMNSFAGNNLNRYIPVSVERGWQSKRDFIGYFNPLTRRYDKNNSKVYDALRLLDTERENSKYPLLILLDEANLSPLEYYWADFMRFADQSEISNRWLNIGTEPDIYIPETLRFVATVNTDQTTEQLSPRFIDRACLIKLPHVTSVLPKKPDSESEQEKFAPIPWKNLVEVFDSPKTDTNSPLLNIRERIYELFMQHNLCVSPRVALSIERYMQVAQGIMDSEGVVRSQEKALDYAVLQKLLPKINGNYDSYRGLFEKLKTISIENHLFMTLQAIETMEKFQKDNMGYCQYLV